MNCLKQLKLYVQSYIFSSTLKPACEAKISKPCCRHNMAQRSTAKLFVETVKSKVCDISTSVHWKVCQLRAREFLGVVSLNFYPAGISHETHLQTQWFCLGGENLQYLLPNYSRRLIPLTQFHRKHTRLATSHDRNSLWSKSVGSVGELPGFKHALHSDRQIYLLCSSALPRLSRLQRLTKDLAHPTKTPSE